MARIVKQLTDTEIKKSIAKNKIYKLSDGNGLYLVIKTNGTKFFRYDFIFGGKRRSMSFGVYPGTTLKEARDKRDEARKQIEKNINPIQTKKIAKDNQKNTFKIIANEWFSNLEKSIAKQTATNYKKTFEKNVFPKIGNSSIHELTRKDIINILKTSTNTKRIYNLLTRIFSYATIHYDLKYNVCDFRINDVITSSETKNHTAIIEEKNIKDLIFDIKNLNYEDEYYHYSPVIALKILPYMFMRISSLLLSKWEHIDLEEGIWFFPAANMKTRKDFIYPIPVQVKQLLVELKSICVINSEFVFHSAQNKPEKHLSRASVGSYLVNVLKYKNEMTLHGFRATFSTIAYEKQEEHGYSEFIIEACLAHSDSNKVRSAYNRDNKMKYINQKRELIQWYADFLDSL